jgi:hypothetical protein
MKAKDAKNQIPSAKKLALYAVVVAAACFLNCLALQAADYKKYTGDKNRKPLAFLEPRGIIPGTSNLFTFGGPAFIWEVSQPVAPRFAGSNPKKQPKEVKAQRRVKQHNEKTGER